MIQKKSVFNGVTLCILALVMGCKQTGTKDNEWRVYKSDPGGTSYSLLKDISPDNIARLKQAWVCYFDYDPAKAPKIPDVNNSFVMGAHSNPIIIDSVMFTTSRTNSLFALDARTGKVIWSYNPITGDLANLDGGQSRGVAYWEDGDNKVILFTAAHYLFAVNAITGQLMREFGVEGKVDLNVGMRDDPSQIYITTTSPGIIYKDLIILGSSSPHDALGVPGYERAYNVRTGKLEWTFHNIPQPGEEGYETWPRDAWKRVGGANNWGGGCLDEKRGIVYFGTATPSYNYYGGDRKGMNLFANCIIALDAATGKMKWYFQTVHHSIWEYDLAAPPTLVTLNKGGEKIDAVVQVSKTGFIYVLDRETGKPVYPIEEHAVPPSDIPGEDAWPTQPFPATPAPLSAQHISGEDLSDFPGADHQWLVDKFKSLRNEGIFTPPSQRGTLTIPGLIGGVEWGGAAFDPETGILYTKSNNFPEISNLKKRADLLGGHIIPTTEYAKGQAIYSIYCATCHGVNRKGSRNFPSLVGISNRVSEQDVRSLLMTGRGMMPSFRNTLRDTTMQGAIISYLFDNKSTEANKEKIGAKVVASAAGAKSSIEHEIISNAAKAYVKIPEIELFRDNLGNPGIRPPWGVLNAVNLNTGQYVWKTPHGNNPKLQSAGAPPTGEATMPGPIVTAGGIVFISGTRDHKMTAFDKNSGEKIWEVLLPGLGDASPSTYSCGGRQFVVITFSPSKEHPGGGVIAYSL